MRGAESGKNFAYFFSLPMTVRCSYPPFRALSAPSTKTLAHWIRQAAAKPATTQISTFWIKVACIPSLRAREVPWLRLESGDAEIDQPRPLGLTVVIRLDTTVLKFCPFL